MSENLRKVVRKGHVLGKSHCCAINPNPSPITILQMFCILCVYFHAQASENVIVGGTMLSILLSCAVEAMVMMMKLKE